MKRALFPLIAAFIGLGALSATADPVMRSGSAPQSALSLTNTLVQVGTTAPHEATLLYCYNPGASAAFVQVFDAASGAVTLGSTAPLQSFGIAAGQSGGFALTNGLHFYNAFTLAASATYNGSGAPSSALICNTAIN